MPEIRVGCALSDVNRADLPSGLRVPERLADYARRFQERVGRGNFFFELQPEDFWTIPAEFPDQFVERKPNRWWRAFRENARLFHLFKSASSRVGVHQPIQARDVLSSNFFLKYAAIAETKQAMAFAEFIGADYFVFHLTMTDRWEWERRDQMEKALKMFKAFTAFYHASQFTFTPCIEILEYPKFPATGGEALALLTKCRAIWPATKLAFDISHLWGSRQRMIAVKLWDDPSRSFIDALDYALSQTWDGVHVFHLGGCWESETHAVPGLHPQQDPFRYPIKLRESANVYAEMGEMDLNRVLDLLLAYTVRRGRDLNLVLQIFNRDIGQVLEATHVIQEELNARAGQPAPTDPPPKTAEREKKTEAKEKTRGRKK